MGRLANLRLLIRDGVGAVGLVVLLSAPAFGQGARSGPEPRLPGAVTTAPSWLVDAPFDVAGFFAMPPPSENAAPLYLAALLDFGGDMALCLPPDRRNRGDEADARRIRIQRAFEAWDKDRDPAHLDRAEIDAFGVVMRETLQKLDAAQRRPRCVFATGITYDVPIPHLQASREPVRLWSLLAFRALDWGDVEGAIGYARRILPLSRDIRPRGHVIAQLLGSGFGAMACNFLIPRILAHPRLQANHCDQVLRLLREQEARTADSFATGVKAEYVTERIIIRTFEERIALTVDPNGRLVEKRLDEDGVARFFMQLAADIMGNTDPANRLDPRRLNDPASLARIKAQLRAMNLNFAREHQALDAYVKSMLSLSAVPCAQRVPRVESVLRPYDPRSVPAGQGASLVMMILPDYRKTVESAVRDSVYVGAAQCLSAVRRWQLLHQGRLAGLAEMCRAAGLPRVPIDDYSGSPLRMALVAGQPVVYSVGPDGDDDGGLTDAGLGRVPDGDFLFRLAKPAAPARR